MAFDHQLGRFRLGLREALARLGVAEGGFLAALGGQHDGLLLAFGFEDGALPQAFGLENLRTLFALGLHLAGHAVDQVARRRDVLDLDAGDLDAPRLGGGIDDLQQPRVDLVAVGEQLVEVHRAHDGADVGHGEVDDGAAQLIDLVGGLGGVQHLVEVDAIDRHHGVVLGDDVLRGNIDHLLLHVHLVADALHHRDQDVQARLQRPRIAAEGLDRVVVALRHHLHRGPQGHQGQHDHQHDEDFKAAGEDVHGRSRSLQFSSRYGGDSALVLGSEYKLLMNDLLMSDIFEVILGSKTIKNICSGTVATGMPANQSQPANSRRTTCSMTAMPPGLSLRQGT